jgi:hypothetical protein
MRLHDMVVLLALLGFGFRPGPMAAAEWPLDAYGWNSGIIHQLRIGSK